MQETGTGLGRVTLGTLHLLTPASPPVTLIIKMHPFRQKLPGFILETPPEPS